MSRLLYRLRVVMAAVLFSAASWGQAAWTKQSPATSPPGRIRAAMAQFGNYTVMFGGETSVAGNYLGDTWLWDGTNWTQVTSFGLFGTGAQPSPRSLASMAYDPDTGQVVLFGGLSNNGVRLNDTWTLGFVSIPLLNRTVLEWNPVTTLASPPARDAAVMEYDPASKTVVLTNGYPNLQDTWSFTPPSGSTAASWTQVSPAQVVTPGRGNSAMAKCGQLVPRFYLTSSGYQLFYVDGSPQQLLLFAGGGGFLNDSWFLSGSSPSTFDWSNQSFASPPQRTDHAMAYYPVSNRVVLYGGFEGITNTSFNILGDTWNGVCGSNFPGWAQVNPTPNPGPRFQHAMATGPGGYTVVLFGGFDQNINVRNDTWTWGRRAACIPASGSEIDVGSEAKCQFATEPGIVFGGWTAEGFAPPASDDAAATFHTEAPSAPLAASITAHWSDATGQHTQTYTYTIVRPNRKAS